jgi:pimeloyl-ACP methyl ester carboxylesterase
MEEHALIEKNISLFYRTTGTGSPVMLVHGFAEDGHIWDELVPTLEKRYRLIIPDHIGSGRSTGNLEGLSMESLADNLQLIVEKEKLQDFAMIGHSMGGYVTLAYAEKYPERLGRFGLFHSTAFEDSAEKKAGREKNIAFISKYGSAKFQEQAIPNLFSEESRTRTPEKVSAMIGRYSNFSPSALVAYTKAMKDRPERIHVLKNFKKAVLFIMGEKDTAVPIEQGLKQCGVPELSYIYIAAQSGHLGMLEEPEFCLKALQDFLSGE